KTANWPRQRSHIRIADSTNVTLRQFRIDSIDPNGVYDVNLEAQHGVSVAGGASHVLVEDVTVHGVYGDCVSVSATDVTVRRATCIGIGRQGMSITDGGDLLVEDSHIERVGRSAFDIEPIDRIGGGVAGVTVRNTTFVAPIANTILAWSGSGPI